MQNQPTKMTQDDENLSIPNNLPTEVLLMIFAYLPAKKLLRLREVCTRWRNVVDAITRSDSVWWGHCQREFSNVYKVARRQAREGMLWFNIYRSLSLWPQLKHAREIRDEFAFASTFDEEIRGFQILKDGIIGVHKRGSIVYYDIETLEPTKRGPITGDYMRYYETEDLIIIRGYHLHLFVIRKVLRHANSEPNVTFDGVKFCLIVDKELYYVNLENDIYLCNLNDRNLSSRLLKHSDESVMCLGYSDYLNVLTYQRKIYSIVKGNLVLACDLDESENILDELYKFKLIQYMDWRVFYQWMFILRRRVPEGPLQYILTVRVYGDIVLVGCNFGVFRIYHSPFKDGKMNLYDAEPVKQYNFNERSDCPVLSMCPILKIDVMEAEDGHTIIVAMPKKIAVLHFMHSFKRTASVAMLPYSEVQRVKVIRIDSSNFNESI